MNNLKRIRMELGISQKKLAEAVGVSGPFLFDLENGNRNAKPETWKRIADALGCTVEDIRGKGDFQSEACCGD